MNSAPTPSPRIAIEAHGLCRSFGKFQAIAQVSFQARAGEVCGFIGPNGAGKTTTMRILATLDLPDAGDARIEGSSVLEHPREVRRRLGFMPDSFGVYANTTAWEYLDFFGRAYELRGAQRRSRVQEVSEFTGLTPLLEREIKGFSKGMKQRLCLAKTLLHDPAVLILDEPAAGLDPRARVELRELVKALASMGKCVLVSSHILTELAEMCTSVVVIEKGRIKAHGTVDSIARALKPRSEVRVRALCTKVELLRALHELPDVHKAHVEGLEVVFETEANQEQRAALLASLVQRGLKPVEFAVRETNLEEVFLSLTRGEVQ